MNPVSSTAALTALAALLCFPPAIVAQSKPSTRPHKKKRSLPAMKLRAMPLIKPKAKSPAELTKLYEKLLAEPFVEKGGWMTDYDAARARAKKEGKLLFAYFTRSYAY